MALVDPNIAMSFRAPEIKAPNMLAQYAQLAQLQGAQQSQQVNQLRMEELQMQMQKMRQADAAMERIRQAAMQHGGPDNLDEIARAYMQSPVAEHQTLGLRILEQQREKTAFQQTYGRMFPGLFPEAPAPVAAPVPEPSGAVVGGAIAPPSARVTPTPLGPPGGPAPVNAMAPAGTIEAMPINQLRATQIALGASSDPRAKTLSSVIEKEIERRKPAAPTELDKVLEKLKDPTISASERTFYENRAKILTTERPGVKVTVGGQEGKEREERGKFLAGQYAEISKAAGIASRTLPGIESNLAILNKGFETGFGTATVSAAASILGALGVADAKQFATDAQIFQSKATEAILQKQLEQKGPQTEADAKRIDQIGAQLGKTADANKFILRVAKAQFNRDREQRAFWDKWWKDNKTYDGAEDAWYAGEGGKSLFDRPELKNYAVSAVEQIPTPAAQIPTPGGRTIVRTGTSGGRKVNQYSDGSIEYAD